MRWLLTGALLLLLSGCAVQAPRPVAESARSSPAAPSAEIQSRDAAVQRSTAMLCPPSDPADRSCGRRHHPQPQTGVETDPPQGAPADLWARLRDGLAMNSCAAGPDVLRSAARYTRSPASFEATLSRTLPLIEFVAKQVMQRDLPSELVWIPMVESSYVQLPPNRHLAGMWQIAQITSSELDLRRDLNYDARVDPISSTRAALDLLQHLHSQLEQNWFLAILGYNAGEFALKAALRRQASSIATPGELDKLDLRAVTYGHLRRTLALSCIMAEPERFGVTLPSFEDIEPLQQLRLEHPIDLRLAARLAGIDNEALLALNSGFLQPWTPPAGPHRLLLPRWAASTLSAELNRLPAQWWSGWRWHPLAADTALVELPNEASVPLSLLAKVNGLDSIATRLPDGTRALIHQPGLQQQRSAAAEQRALEAVTHRVQAGDSLWRLSRRYRVSIDELRRWNQLGASNTLRIGQSLIVGRQPTAATPALGSYRVRPRDSIWLIARRHGLRAEQLMRWNQIVDPALLRVGQTLRLSPSGQPGGAELGELPSMQMNR